MIKKYCRVLEEVEAVQATETNLSELRSLAGDVKKIEKNAERPTSYSTENMNQNNNLNNKHYEV